MHELPELQDTVKAVLGRMFMALWALIRKQEQKPARD